MKDKNKSKMLKNGKLNPKFHPEADKSKSNGNKKEVPPQKNETE